MRDAKVWGSLACAKVFMRLLQARDGDALTDFWDQLSEVERDSVTMIFALVAEERFAEYADRLYGLEGVRPAGLSNERVWQIATESSK